MHRLDYIQTWWIFLLRDVMLCAVLSEYIKKSKEKLGAGKSYGMITIVNYLTIFFVVLGIVVCNHIATAEIPMLVNYDYKVVSGQVEWIGKEPYYEDKEEMHKFETKR